MTLTFILFQILKFILYIRQKSNYFFVKKNNNNNNNKFDLIKSFFFVSFWFIFSLFSTLLFHHHLSFICVCFHHFDSFAYINWFGAKFVRSQQWPFPAINIVAGDQIKHRSIHCAVHFNPHPKFKTFLFSSFSRSHSLSLSLYNYHSICV